SLHRKRRAARGTSPHPLAIQALPRARVTSDSEMSSLLIAFALSVCPYLLILSLQVISPLIRMTLTHERTKGEYYIISHYGPASRHRQRRRSQRKRPDGAPKAPRSPEPATPCGFLPRGAPRVLLPGGSLPQC